jgi:hypothetical protein
MKRLAALFLILLIPLGACSTAGIFTPDSPDKALAVAKALHTGTNNLAVAAFTAALKAGVSKEALAPHAKRYEAVRQASRLAIDLAEKMLQSGDPELEKYARLALEEALRFREVIDAIKEAL